MSGVCSRWAAALSRPNVAGGTLMSGCKAKSSGWRKYAWCRFPHFQCDLSGPNLRSSSDIASLRDCDRSALVSGTVLRLARTERGLIRGTGRIFAVSLELSLPDQTSKMQASFESVRRSASQWRNWSRRAASSAPSGVHVSRSFMNCCAIRETVSFWNFSKSETSNLGFWLSNCEIRS